MLSLQRRFDAANNPVVSGMMLKLSGGVQISSACAPSSRESRSNWLLGERMICCAARRCHGAGNSSPWSTPAYAWNQPELTIQRSMHIC